MRYSKQRELILSIVRGTDCHPDAEWIYSQAKQQIPNISLGTVYRNLKYLASQGALQTLETESNTLRYDGDTSDHIHYICKSCWRIFDFFQEPKLKKAIEKKGHTVEQSKIVFYGYCARCKTAHGSVV